MRILFSTLTLLTAASIYSACNSSDFTGRSKHKPAASTQAKEPQTPSGPSSPLPGFPNIKPPVIDIKQPVLDEPIDEHEEQIDIEPEAPSKPEVVVLEPTPPDQPRERDETREQDPTNPMPPPSDKPRQDTTKQPGSNDQPDYVEVDIPECDGGDDCDDTYNYVAFGFEDSVQMWEKDWNDAVLCFGGAFYVNYLSGEIISKKDQRIEATLKRISMNDQDVLVRLKSMNGTIREAFHDTTLEWRAPARIRTIDFKRGDRLLVNFSVNYTWNGYHVDENVMPPHPRIKVESDQCRLTGI